MWSRHVGVPNAFKFFPSPSSTHLVSSVLTQRPTYPFPQILARSASSASFIAPLTQSMSKASALGQSLKHITNLKLREVERQRQLCRTHVENALAVAASMEDPRDRVESLLASNEEWKGMSNLVSTNVSTKDIAAFLLQSRYDPSTSLSMIEGWAIALEKGLKQALRRNEFAKLFADLLNEWLESGDSLITSAPMEELDDAASMATSTGSWQTKMPRGEKQAQSDKIQELIFTPAKVDIPAIEAHLESLFASKAGAAALANVRQSLATFGDNVSLNFELEDGEDTKTLIRSLLSRDLLSAEKTATVQSFLDSEIILQEITSVLNLQLKSLDSWDWPEEGVDVEMRRHLSGKYRAYLDNEIVQALLFQRIGIVWSVELKRVLRREILDSPFWKRETDLLSQRELRRQYDFLSPHSHASSELPSIQEWSIQSRREKIQRDQFFLTQLPSKEDDDADYSDDVPKVEESKFSQQTLLRLASTEVLLHKEIHGSATILRSDLEWFGPSLPHDSILTVLKFYGLPERWLKFFEKWLRSRLCFDRTEGVKVRERGVPIAHSLSVFCGEAVLSGLDLSINQHAGGTYLYRIYDDFWLFSPSSTNVAAAWSQMQTYTSLLGIKLNMNKTGAGCVGATVDERLPKGNVEWGFLVFDDKTGGFKVNQTIVETHIKELRVQLGATTSVFGFVNVLNKYLSFFRRNFAQPARCLGTSHLDEVAKTMAHIVKSVLPPSTSGSIVLHLQSLIASRFAVQEVPAGWCFLNSDEGGLGVVNPAVELLPLRKSLTNVGGFEKCAKDDEKNYEYVKRKWQELNGGEGEEDAMQVDGFVTWDQFKSTRETLMDEWGGSWATSQEVAWSEQPSQRSWKSNGEENAAQSWIVQKYRGELLDYFGALEVADKDLIPTGLLQAFRSSKVAWDQ